MQEQTFFIADDGEQFETKEDCVLWERMKPKYKNLVNIEFKHEDKLIYDGDWDVATSFQILGYDRGFLHRNVGVKDLKSYQGRGKSFLEVLKQSKKYTIIFGIKKFH